MTKGKRGRLEGALRAWRRLSKADKRAVMTYRLNLAGRCDCFTCDAVRVVRELLRAAGVATRKERK